MNYSTCNHCSGTEKVPRELQDEVAEAIGSAKVRVTKGAGTSIRDAILQPLLAKGWSGEVSVSKDSGMTITSTKSGVGLCLQTGNMARMYADLLKLQKLYVDSAIASAVMIVPSSPAAKVLGDNIVHGDRLERELEIFQRVIYVPICLYVIG